MVTEKACTRCGIVQPRVQFNKHPRGKDGLQSVCKTCSRLASSDRRALIKDKVFEFFGAVCVCCGETERLFLTLDHKNNDGAEHRRQLGARNRVSSTDVVFRWLVKTEFAEADRFQVLCYNCNCGRRSNFGVCPHHLRRGRTK